MIHVDCLHEEKLSTNILFDGGQNGNFRKKIGMTQIFEDGKIVPVTVIEAGPNFVLQTKTTENDGYVAIQVGFDEKEKILLNL